MLTKSKDELISINNIDQLPVCLTSGVDATKLSFKLHPNIYIIICSLKQATVKNWICDNTLNKYKTVKYIYFLNIAKNYVKVQLCPELKVAIFFFSKCD